MGDRFVVVSWILHDDHSAPARELPGARGDCAGHS
jgi:hypothetical protein